MEGVNVKLLSLWQKKMENTDNKCIHVSHHFAFLLYCCSYIIPAAALSGWGGGGEEGGRGLWLDVEGITMPLSLQLLSLAISPNQLPCCEFDIVGCHMPKLATVLLSLVI